MIGYFALEIFKKGIQTFPLFLLKFVFDFQDTENIYSRIYIKYLITGIQIKSDVLNASKKLHKANFGTLITNILKIVIIHLIRDFCFISAETWF